MNRSPAAVMPQYATHVVIKMLAMFPGYHGLPVREGGFRLRRGGWFETPSADFPIRPPPADGTAA